MTENTMKLLFKSVEVAHRLVEEHKLDCSFDGNGDLALWAEDVDGYVKTADEVDCHMPLGLTPKDVESFLSLNGAENAVYRALAAKAGIPVRTADWFYFNVAPQNPNFYSERR
jgi:hypothetical protein